MPHFRLYPQYASSWTQRTIERLGLRVATCEVPLLEASDGGPVHFDTLMPEDAHLPAPVKPVELGCQQSSGSGLLQLPLELLVCIMGFLPHSCLYMVHQTCKILRQLAHDVIDFHRDILHFAEKTHRGIGSTCDQLRLIKRVFLRRSLCEPCGNLLDSGELETRLRRLWQPIRCTGCNQNHPELLFPQGNERGNICVGLLGHFTLCKHVKVLAKIQPNYKDGLGVVCTHPEHRVATRKDDENPSAVTRRRPCIRTLYSGDIQVIESLRCFPMVKINQRQFPGMPALQANLLKQLKERVAKELCRHASTQIDSIASCMISGECNCFPASGVPVHKVGAPYGRNVKCPNHGYNCRHCGARYFWYYEDDYIVLRHEMRTRNTGPDSFGWLSNLTFETDEHPIFNDNTKGVLWCDIPACGTGCGNRWLLMLEILQRTSLRCNWSGLQVPPRDLYSALSLPFTLEYQVFQDAAEWPTDPDMLSQDLVFPTTTSFSAHSGLNPGV
ncbi:hypothetical protein FBULB1_11876 [Fusarium bulbicola]|nr:hypothetical protein FBULB1_11876 [Fusarium bulbicola]